MTKTGTDIEYAARLLQGDELVAIPTETVYGLAANACSEVAIRKVFAVKQRPLTNPLIVHVDGIEAIRCYTTFIPPVAEALLAAFAPGPLTLLLPSNNILPPLVNDGRRELAFRIPAHPLTLALLREVKRPLVAPSANVFTTISPTNPQHVLKNFGGRIPYILDGGTCTVGIESTVVGFDEEQRPVIYRQGAFTADDIQRVAGSLGVKKNILTTPSPGMLPHHYSPSTPLRLIDDVQRTGFDIDFSRTGILSFHSFHAAFPPAHQFVLSVEKDLQEAARNLYKGLHFLDDLKLDLMLAEKLPNIGIGIAINDRLQRAAHPSAHRNQKTVNF